MLSALLSNERNSITQDDLVFGTEQCFPDFTISTIKDSEKVNGEFLGMCYGNNLMHMGSVNGEDKPSNSVLQIQKPIHVLNMTNLYGGKQDEKSPFASVQSLEYSALPNTTFSLPQSVEGIFVRFAIYPQI